MNDPSNPKLEARIAQNPKDDAAWQVYADWLNEKGAPRGEFAALQLAYEKKRLPSLRKKADAILEANTALFLGKAEPAKLRWKAGFWQKLTLQDATADFDAHLALQSARLCQSMILSSWEDDQSAIAHALAKNGPFPALRHLTIGEEHDLTHADADSWLDARTCHGIADLPAALPNLRSLELCEIEDFDFGSFPNLRELRISSAVTDIDALRGLFATRLPRLRTLILNVGTRNGDAPAQPLAASDFAELAKGANVPRLEKLVIHAFSDEETLIADLESLFAEREDCVINDEVTL